MIRKLLTKLVIAKHLPKNPYPGEMLPVERLRLYQWMTEHHPKVVLEVGTGVGGSTFYMSEALKKFGGVLHTCDPLRRPPEDFLNRFRNTLHYHPVHSDELISQMRRDGVVPDFVFLTGRRYRIWLWKTSKAWRVGFNQVVYLPCMIGSRLGA